MVSSIIPQAVMAAQGPKRISFIAMQDFTTKESIIEKVALQLSFTFYTLINSLILVPWLRSGTSGLNLALLETESQ